MKSIIVKCDEQPIQKLELNSGAVSIGRATDNDLHITDSTVSSHHARIFTYFDVSYIEDLDSRNGTYINGKRIQKHTLHPGDIVKLGRHHLLEVEAEPT